MGAQRFNKMKRKNSGWEMGSHKAIAVDSSQLCQSGRNFGIRIKSKQGWPGSGAGLLGSGQAYCERAPS